MLLAMFGLFYALKSDLTPEQQFYGFIIQFWVQNLKFQNLPIVRASTFYFFFFCHQQLQVILYAAWAWMMEYLVEPLHKVSPWFWQYPTLFFSLNELHIEFKVFTEQLLHKYLNDYTSTFWPGKSKQLDLENFRCSITHMSTIVFRFKHVQFKEVFLI